MENPDDLLALKRFRKEEKGMKKFSVVIMLMLSLVVAVAAKAVTMEDLIRPGAFLIVDDKKFYDFVFISAAVPPGNIAVEPIDTPFNPGLRFGGGLFAPQGGFNVVDVGIEYKVEVLPGGSAIKDISLLTAAYVLIGNGMASVGESVFLGNALIGSLQNEVGQQFGLADFDPTYGPITVLKDILLIAPGPGDFAAFSIVEQRFSETTTPSNQPPVAKCHDVTVSTGSTCTASPFSISNGSYDPDGDPITLAQFPTGPYPLGITPMTLKVTDSKGASSECTGKVTVVDKTPPTITFASATPSVLWPPNHKMVPVTLTVTATDNCDGTPACKIISVSSNEPKRSFNDGDSAGPDWQVTGNLTVNLRSERSERAGNGRIYTINLICSDAAGNSSSTSLTVSVPRIKK